MEIKSTCQSKRSGKPFSMGADQRYLAGTPAAAAIFDFLERHWPKLVNGVESDSIPTINNTVELAGYDISQTPMVTICAGLSVAWAVEILQTHVPNQ